MNVAFRSLLALARNHKRIAGPLRTIHYRFWRATGVTGVSGAWPELGRLREIVRRSDPTDLLTPPDGKRVLVVTFRNWITHSMWDSLTAHALRARGARVEVYSCGGRLPNCDIAAHVLAPPMPCNTCAPYISEVYATLRIPHHEMRDFITGAERASIERTIAAVPFEEYRSFTFDDLPLGRMVVPSLQWFMLSGNLRWDEETKQTYRRFLVSAALTARAAARVLDRVRPDVLYALNGILFAERIFVELARRRGIEFVTHDMGFMADAQVFTRNGFAPYYDLDAVWPHYAARPLDEQESARLDAYLLQRATGRSDATVYYPDIKSDVDAVARELALDARPVVALFTNVDWDTAVYTDGAAFPTMEQWLHETVEFFIRNPERQLVIRIHPAEVRLPFLPPRDKVGDMIRRLFPILPEHIKVVEPESSISSYTLMEMSSLALVYTSTTGLEMALRGKPVLVGGRAYYGGKGFTLDARDPAHHGQLLAGSGTAERLGEQQIQLARRYACLFFFRHHLPFPLMRGSREGVEFLFDDLAALRPGREPWLDLVCDGVLRGTPFLYTGPL